MRPRRDDERRYRSPRRPVGDERLRSGRHDATLARRYRRRRATAVLICAVVVAALAVLLGAGNPSVKRATRPHPLVSGPGQREAAAVERQLARTPLILAGGSRRREIAITFDDGPGPDTPKLLDTLDSLHAPATFFEVGAMIRVYHASLAREVRSGQAIGDHTELHPVMAALTPAAQRDQIVVQTEWLHRYGAPFPRLYRPPYGSFNAATLRILHQLHMLMVLWTVDTKDYSQPGAAAIEHAALARAKPGAIILMHDGGGPRAQTITALPGIVRGLRARGYTLVTVPRLLLDDPPQHQPPLPSARLASG